MMNQVLLVLLLSNSLVNVAIAEEVVTELEVSETPIDEGSISENNEDNPADDREDENNDSSISTEDDEEQAADDMVDMDEDLENSFDEASPFGDESYEGESQINRDGKTFHLGLILGSNNTKGLNLAYYVSDISRVFLDYAFGEVKNSGELLSRALRSKADFENYRLSWLQFVGNSFYWNLGLRTSSIDYERYYYANENAEADLLFNYTLNSTAIFLGIGSEWQWENFFIGCEWLGLSRVLTYHYDIYYSDSDERAKAKDHAQTTAKNAFAIYGLQLQFGFSF